MSDYKDQQYQSRDDEETVQSETPGELLAKKREEAGLSHAAVGEALHLTVHYIKALESNEYSKLPGQTFIKGYIRSYARFLKMDTSAVLACYEAHLNSLGIDGSSEYGAGMRKRSDQTLLWAIAAGVVLVLALSAGWWFFGREQDRPATASAQFSTTPRPVTTASTVQEPVRTTTPAFNVNPVIDTTSPVQEDAVTGLQESFEDIAGPDELVAILTSVNEAVESADAPDGLVAENVRIITPENGEAAGQEAGNESQAAAPATPVNTTVDATDAPIDSTAIADAGPRHVSLMGEGEDLAEFSLSGTSWVEVNDAEGNRLFQDMLGENDTLSIRGTAPFQVLLGDARNVSLVFNDAEVDLGSSTRNDNTARLSLEAGEGAR
jgi:cytoskeleton protein RodZ